MTLPCLSYMGFPSFPAWAHPFGAFSALHQNGSFRVSDNIAGLCICSRLGFSQNRVLPEPEPPIIRTFLFLAVWQDSSVGWTSSAVSVFVRITLSSNYWSNVTAAMSSWLFPNGQNHTPHCAGTSWRFCFSDKPPAEGLPPQAHAHQQIQRMKAGKWIAQSNRKDIKKAEDFCRRICTLSQPPCFSKIRCKQSHQNIRDVQNQELFQIDSCSSQITLLFLFPNLPGDSCYHLFELLQLCQNTRFLILRQ